MTTTLGVKERPILFSAAMVRAILAGTKSMTRRVVKPQPAADFAFMPLSTELVGCGDPARGWARCPYGMPGDRLWVRESWRGWLAGDYPCVDYKAGGGDPYGCNPPRPGYDIDHPCWSDWKWRPSIFMPRWASRITLEIESVRVERLHDITPEDIEAEGFAPDATLGNRRAIDTDRRLRDAFRETWDRLNGPRGFGWDASPWVWAITFRRREGGAR